MAINKEYNDVQLDVNFTQASTRANLVSEENISVSFGKLAKWYEALVPTGGSSGKILAWNSSGTAKWSDPLHPTITKSADTTSTASPAHGGTFTTVDTVTRDAYGHVTKINTKTVTLPNDTLMTQTNTTGSADYRVLLSGNANDTTETTTGRKSTNLKFNPSSGGLYSFGFLWTDITGQTLDINTLTLSDGTLHSRRFIEKTDGGAGNITNIPVAGKPFLLEVDLIRWGSTTDYITRQRFTNAANGTYSYVRYCTNGTWGSWTTRKYTDTDTKVTSSANHYAPATVSGEDKSASASGATAAWSIDVVKGVTLNTDGKGHVTGLSVTSGKIPANPVPSNNVTGSGTSGYLTKWNGTNTITNGPQLGSSTTTFLRNDGTWATPTNTTYSANNGVGLSGTTFYNSGVRAVSTGSANGTISVNTNGTSANVAVKGLASAAYVTQESLLRARSTVSTDGGATGWSQIGINQYNNAYPDGVTNKIYSYGAVVSIPAPNARFDLYYNHNSSTAGAITNGLQYRTGWDNDKKVWKMLLDNDNYGSYMTYTSNRAGYASSDTHILQLGYFVTDGSYDNCTILVSSAFWGNQHGSSDIINYQQSNNTNDTPAIHVTMSRIRIGGSVGRTFYYKADNTNNRVYLYVHVTGGNSYGRWNTTVLQSSGLTTYWRQNMSENQANSGLTEIAYTGRVDYATTALSVSTAGGDVVLGTSSSSSDDSGDIVWKYGNGQEKARIYLSNTYTAKEGPLYRIFKSDGTGLYSGRLPLADGTSASGTWGISITGNAANVTGTVAIANGGTGATTRLAALKNLTNESVGTSANYFLTITSSWGKGGYTSVADAKTVLGLKSAAYTESSAYLSSTTKYAGSSSVGGAANSANVLNYNNSVTATTSGLQYTHGQITIGAADDNAAEGSNASYKLWSYPTGGTATSSTSANIQNLRLYWSSAYFRDIFLSPNNDMIYHRAVINNSAKPWYVLLDSNNLETYSLHTPDTAKALSTGTGQNMSPITRPQNLHNRSNKLALIPGSNITVEYSTDAGSNWTDMGLTADMKGNLFNDTISATIPIGPNNSTDRTTSMQTRITITCDGRDQMIDQYILWLDSSYQTISIDLQVTYGNATTTFTNIRTGLSCPPWNYQYILNTETKRFGTSTTSAYVNKIRFVIKYTGINGSHKTSKAIIHSIAGYSGIYWGGAAKNNLMIYDHLYTWDNSQNATFPAQLNATGATFTSSSYGALSIKRTSTNNAGIKFYNNGSTYLGSLAIDTVNGTFHRFKTDDSTMYEIIDRSVVRNNTTVGTLGWTSSSADTVIPTVNTIAYWNGAYSGTSSNLAYCNKGAFGTIVTKSTTDYSKVTSSTTNGNIKIDGTETTVYTHPSYTSKTSGLYKITVDSTGHVSATASVAKGDIPALDYVPFTKITTAADADTYAANTGWYDWNTTSGTNMPTENWGILLSKKYPSVQMFLPDTGTAIYLRNKANASTAGTSWMGITGTAGNTYNLNNFLPLSGGKMTGTIQGTYTNTHIALASGGIGDYATLDHKNNINISSWNGVSISNGCSSVGTLDQVTFSVNARTGTTQQRGNAILYSESGNSPALIFQRGTSSDGTYDWKLYVTEGHLNFDRNSSGTWTNLVQFEKTGNLYVSGTIYSNNTPVSLEGHTHEYVPLKTNGGIATISGQGQYTWCTIATITVVSAYADGPISFEVSERGGSVSLIQVSFVSANTTDPALKYFVSNYSNRFYIKKTATSTWEIYGSYTESYGAISLHRVFGYRYNNATNVTIHMSNVSEPTGLTRVTYGGNVASANALNLAYSNEINFSKLSSTGHVWFGYRWNTQGTETSGGTTITTYKFGNANGGSGSTPGLAGLEAGTATFKHADFGQQLIVERTGGANMAGITFKNTNGVLGHIAANTVDGDLYHYGASDTSTMKYVILDSHNYTSYACGKVLFNTDTNSSDTISIVTANIPANTNHMTVIFKVSGSAAGVGKVYVASTIPYIRDVYLGGVLHVSTVSDDSGSVKLSLVPFTIQLTTSSTNTSVSLIHGTPVKIPGGTTPTDRSGFDIKIVKIIGGA